MAPINIQDMQALAKKRLPRLLYDYLDGGSYDEVTLRANISDLAELRLVWRVLTDVSKVDLSTTVFGERLSMPLILGPVGSLGVLARRGDIAAAKAAEACGITSCLSTAAISSVEEVAAARKEPIWFQLYVMQEPGHFQELIRRAKAARCKALVLTVDSNVPAQRERDVRHGYAYTAKVKPSNVLDMLTRIRWMIDVPMGPKLSFGSMPGGKGNFKRIMSKAGGGLIDRTLTWEHLKTIRGMWDGPLVIKGILSPHDAVKAVEHGVDGIVVSNHGGRQVDGAISTIKALGPVVDAVNDKAVVMMDGGIRRGHDIIKALAMGAKACFIGRGYAYGLAADGQRGVETSIEFFRKEMSSSLAMLGYDSISQLSRECLHRGDWRF
ncbi:alpha-hydroxy acid oxidase [Bosea sp. NPDC055332]